MAGDWHQLTILGFWQPHLHRENIMVRNWAPADRNSMSRLGTILRPLSPVRSEHPRRIGPGSEDILRRTLTNMKKFIGEQSGWGVEKKSYIDHLYHSQSFIITSKATINIIGAKFFYISLIVFLRLKFLGLLLV